MQAGVDHVLDVLPAGDACGDFLLGAGQKFGGYHHILPFSEVPQGAAQILFAGAALVAHGGIKEVDAPFQTPVDDFAGVFLIQRPAVLAVMGIAKAREPMRMRETVRSDLPGFMYRNAAPYARAL